MNSLTISPTINYMPNLPTISISVPLIIRTKWKWFLIAGTAGLVIFFISQVKIPDTARVSHCQWQVLVNYQKHRAERCESHHLGAMCQLPYPENQEFNWENNMSIPTNDCAK